MKNRLTPSLFETAPEFDGETYVSPRDKSRLTAQLAEVRTLMIDGAWRSLAEIENALNHPQASISARLRDLRKEKFGKYEVDRRYVSKGLFEYRVRTPPCLSVEKT